MIRKGCTSHTGHSKHYFGPTFSNSRRSRIMYYLLGWIKWCHFIQKLGSFCLIGIPFNLLHSKKVYREYMETSDLSLIRVGYKEVKCILWRLLCWIFGPANSAQLSQLSEDNLEMHSDFNPVYLFCLNTVDKNSLWTLSVLSLPSHELLRKELIFCNNLLLQHLTLLQLCWPFL